MKKIIGIFRGFPGLGRIVSGVTLLETLRDEYNCEVQPISYLQGVEYLMQHGFSNDFAPSSTDLCSIGILPTGHFGAEIHQRIADFCPDMIIIDGEPLMLQSIKISHPGTKVVALLNPADVVNPSNNQYAMDFFNGIYSLADLAIVHGLKSIQKPTIYGNFVCTNTILRNEILTISNTPSANVYCILGGGTENCSSSFEDTTLHVAFSTIALAQNYPHYTFHILCAGGKIANMLLLSSLPENVFIHQELVEPQRYYSDAAIVITRAGRNTLSELAYLNLPAIVFVSGDEYRIEEQKANLDSLASSLLLPASTDEDLQTSFALLLSATGNNHFEPGNRVAMEYLNSLLFE